MGLYKICEHKGRARDRCGHVWWGSFRGERVSLAKWANRDINSKTEAAAALDELRKAVRSGTFDERGLNPPREVTTLTFGQFAGVYTVRHVQAKGLAIAKTIDYRLKPLIDRFGDRALADIKTADIEDFIADLKLPRVVNRPAGPDTVAGVDQPHDRAHAAHDELGGRPRVPRAHALPARNRDAHPQAQGRQPPAAPAGRGGGNEAAGRRTAVPPVDDHHRAGHGHAARRDARAPVRRHRLRPPPHRPARRDDQEPQDAGRFRSRRPAFRRCWTGCVSTRPARRSRPRRSCSATRRANRWGRFRTAWVTAVLKAHDVKPEWKASGWTALTPALPPGVPADRPAVARPAARVRVTAGRARCPARPGARPAGPRVNHDDGAVRQPEAGEPAARGGQARGRQALRFGWSLLPARRIDDRDELSSFFKNQAKVPPTGCTEAHLGNST